MRISDWSSDVCSSDLITRIEPAVVKALQDDQFIPVISSIGYGEDGRAYNVNADVVAGKMAEVLGAEKLVMMTNTPGVLDKNGELLRRSEEHTSELQSLMSISYAVISLKKKKHK